MATLDAGPIVALYREDAVFQSHPFRPTEPAAEYITRTLAEESAPRASSMSRSLTTTGQQCRGGAAPG